jgi:hypothetical protein
VAIDELTQVCDPDTGICDVSTANGLGDQAEAAGGQQSGPQSASATPVGAITPTVLDASTGWGTAVLLVVVALFTLALILGPALAWIYLRRGSP